MSMSSVCFILGPFIYPPLANVPPTDPETPQGFEVYKRECYLTALYEDFWGRLEKFDDTHKGTNIKFNSSKLTTTSQRLYFFEQYTYLQKRVDALRERDTGKLKRCVIVTGTPGIGNAFYLLSPSDTI